MGAADISVYKQHKSKNKILHNLAKKVYCHKTNLSL